MKIDKSKLTPAELAFLQSIEKRYGEEEVAAGAEGVTPLAQNPEEYRQQRSVNPIHRRREQMAEKISTRVCIRQ